MPDTVHTYTCTFVGSTRLVEISGYKSTFVTKVLLVDFWQIGVISVSPERMTHPDSTVHVCTCVHTYVLMRDFVSVTWV